MSVERRNLVKAYGAEVVLTEGALGMTGAIKKAEDLKNEIDGAVILGQFVNPANPKAHYDTTGPEIWADLEGRIDAFVAGVGTGGTVSGIGKYSLRFRTKPPLKREIKLQRQRVFLLVFQAVQHFGLLSRLQQEMNSRARIS